MFTPIYTPNYTLVYIPLHMPLHIPAMYRHVHTLSHIHSGTQGRASPSALVGCIDGALRRLQTGGYLQGYDILWVVAKNPDGPQPPKLGDPNANRSDPMASAADGSSGNTALSGDTVSGNSGNGIEAAERSRVNSMQLLLLQPSPSGELEAPASVSIDNTHDAQYVQYVGWGGLL